MRASFSLFVLALALFRCSPPRPPAVPDCGDHGRPDAASPTDAPDAPSSAPSHRLRISSASEFAELATPQGEVKFLARSGEGRLPGPLSASECVFSNSVRYPLHLSFLRSLPGLESYSTEQYSDATARRATRTIAPGSLYWRPGAVHPDGSRGVLAYTFSVASNEAPTTVEGWAELDRRLAACVDWPAKDLVLVATDAEQEAWLLRERAALAREGVTVMPRDELTGAIEVYSPGETYGYVRTLAVGQRIADYGARDILVSDSASDDVSIVSALITTFPQSFGSHLNLRMREKRLPNLRWSRARESAELRALEGALVRMTVSPSGEITFARATLDAATCFWRALQQPLPTPAADLSVTDLASLQDLAHTHRVAYGVKAANLGEIIDALGPEYARYRHDGFAIPFSRFAEHVRRNNVTPAIEAVTTDVGLRENRVALLARLESVRDAIRRGSLAPGLLDAIATRVRQTWGAGADTTFVRFRSSTNAEDTEQFSGAGLYDSRTGCLADDLDGDDAGPSRCLTAEHRSALESRLAQYRAELSANPDRTYLAPLIADLEEDLSEEKTVSDALRKVWRSLFNARAFDEREFYGIDHRAVYMGVAVVRTVSMERRESVALTNLPRDGAADGLYRVLSQVGEIGVVRPSIPSAAPEVMTFVRAGAGGAMFTVSQRSTESPAMDLWSESERALLATILVRMQDHFASRVYPRIAPLRLDVEIDVASDGTPLFKQARPYVTN